MNVCLFGSSFNPPHVGHAQIVEGLLKCDFDKVLIVPTGNPNHKKIDIDQDDRIELVRAFATELNVEVSYHEIENNFEYTYQSLNYLNLKNEDKIYFTVGADSVNNLPTWDHFDKLKTMVTFVIIERPGIKLDSSVLEQIDFVKLNINTADISSSQLRKDLNPVQIPNEVYKVIKERNLYSK